MTVPAERLTAQDMSILSTTTGTPYPGFGTYRGFVFSTALILALSSFLYATFKHQGWP